ncbi:MAG: hypothetical protein AAFU60_12860 [Bacteroidota bacterium]
MRFLGIGVVLTVFLIVPFQEMATAQTIRQETAKRNLEQLKNGVLIVRLNTNSKTLEALDFGINNPDASFETRQSLQAQYDQRVHERDSVNNLLLEHFGGETYNYSPVYFMYDTCTYRLKNKEATGYFMDKNLQLSDSMSIEGKNFFMTYIGRTPQTTGTNTRAFIVKDQFFQIPDPPFPGYVTFRKGLTKSKSSKKRDKKLSVFKGYTMEDVVRKFSDVMNWTYHKAQAEW